MVNQHELSDEQSVDIIELIAKNEDTLSRLYRLYANQLPEYREFWERLSDDEMRHKEWVLELIETHAQGLLEINTRRANPELYETYLHFLEGLIQHAEKRPVTAIEAFANAAQAEHTYIERSLLAVVSTDSEGVQRVLEALGHSTERHAEVIDRELARVRAKS